MKKVVIIFLLLVTVQVVQAQNTEEEGVKRACLNYLEGFYQVRPILILEKFEQMIILTPISETLALLFKIFQNILSLSMIVPEIMIGTRIPCSPKYLSMAYNAALQLSVSKTVSIRRISAPPCNSPRVASV